MRIVLCRPRRGLYIRTKVGISIFNSYSHHFTSIMLLIFSLIFTIILSASSTNLMTKSDGENLNLCLSIASIGNEGCSVGVQSKMPGNFLTEIIMLMKSLLLKKTCCSD